MALSITSPAIVRLEGLDDLAIKQARRFLTFKDRGVLHLINQHKKKFYWKRDDPEGWLEHLDELKKQLDRCILFEDEKGFFTYSGLAPHLSEMFHVGIERSISYPDPRGIAWHRMPEHDERYYQENAKSSLLDVKHGAVEMGTGLGKSRIILELCHQLGLQALVVAPSTSIARQLYVDFVKHLGQRWVGLYGDGKKKFDKLFTIALYQSLTRLTPGDPAYDALKTIRVFVVDESHMTPAATLDRVCMGLAKDAEYRFFFSATQTRGDGSSLVLKGITGPIVYSMTVKEGVEQGFLARPQFKMVKVRSSDTFHHPDIQKMQRKHLLYNSDVLAKAAAIADQAVRHLDHKVLMLVDEIPQFAKLLSHFKHEARFAHGAARSDKRMQAALPEPFWDSEPQELVEQFNDEQFPILVGTSCIGTGTDIKACETVINLMGNASPIECPQAVGRGTRRFTFKSGRRKTRFNFVDFAVLLNNSEYHDVEMESEVEDDRSMSPIYRQALLRSQMYRDLYPDLQWLG